MPASLISRENMGQPAMGTRLDCWKEIANYLGRGERTVKRWEADRGLPIHRVPGGGRSSVYAFTSELDKWLKSSEPEEVEATGEPVAEASVHVPVTAELSAADEPEADENSSDAIAIVTPRGGSDHRMHRLLPVVVLLIAGIAIGALRLTALRSAPAGSSFARTPTALEAQKRSTQNSAPAVSDSEKQAARELYLKGRYEWNLRTPDSLNRALDDFTQSIVHDPNYAQAYVGLADTYDLLREYSTMPDKEAFSRSTAAARKAVELDDSLAEAHRALAFAEMYGSSDFVDAEKEFRRAIELNPDDAVARRWYANAIAVHGRFPESLREMDKAQELDPTSHSTLADKGILLFNAGKPKEAVELLEQVERSAPDFWSTHKYLMRIAFEGRNYPAYLSEGKTTARLSNDPVLKNEIALAQAAYKRAGNQGLLQELYLQQRQDYAAGKLSAAYLASTCLQLGRKQEAIQYLEEAYARQEEYGIAASLSDPALLTLKNEPRYQALVQKINFPMPRPNGIDPNSVAALHPTAHPMLSGH